MYVTNRYRAPQRRGVGAYENSGNWTWEFYPQPYAWLGPQNPAPQPAPILGRGLGCGGCASGCGCKKKTAGVGLFDSTDFSTWGIGEYAAIALGVYLVSSLMGDTKRVAKGYKTRQRQRARAKAA